MTRNASSHLRRPSPPPPAAVLPPPGSGPRPCPPAGRLAAWVWNALVDLQKDLFGDSRVGMDPDGLTGSPGGDSHGGMDPDGLAGDPAGE